jgi:hypothetical protein
MLAGVAIASLASGITLDLLYDWSGLTAVIEPGAAGESVPRWLQIAAGIGLAIAIAAALLRKARGHGRASDCSTCRIGELESHDHHRSPVHQRDDEHAGTRR